MSLQDLEEGEDDLLEADDIDGEALDDDTSDDDF